MLCHHYLLSSITPGIICLSGYFNSAGWSCHLTVVAGESTKPPLLYCGLGLGQTYMYVWAYAQVHSPQQGSGAIHGSRPRLKAASRPGRLRQWCPCLLHHYHRLQLWARAVGWATTVEQVLQMRAQPPVSALLSWWALKGLAHGRMGLVYLSSSTPDSCLHSPLLSAVAEEKAVLQLGEPRMACFVYTSSLSFQGKWKQNIICMMGFLPKVSSYLACTSRNQNVCGAASEWNGWLVLTACTSVWASSFKSSAYCLHLKNYIVFKK